MAKKITISFKENERDMSLLIEVSAHGDKSNFIKDCIQEHLDNKKRLNLTQA